MPELAGQVTLITGAAGGIGSVIATKFAAEGSSVVLVDTNSAQFETIGERIKTHYKDAPVLIIQADVTKAPELEPPSSPQIVNSFSFSFWSRSLARNVPSILETRHGKRVWITSRNRSSP